MIYVIGIGIRGRASLGECALGVINCSALLVGGRRHLEEFPDFKGRLAPISGSLEKLAGEIEKVDRNGGDVAVLATGDPLLYGIAGYVIRKFGKDRVEILPNVSTVQEAFSRIKEPWNGTVVLSAHGDGEDRGLEEVVRRVSTADRAAIFTDSKNTPGRIAKELLRRGFAGYTAYVCESLGTKDEKIYGGTLESIARRRRFTPLNIMILIRNKETEIPAECPAGFGIPDNEFSHTRGMITKEELRVVALSKLALTGRSVVWDIGSGCGSVAVEAARLVPDGRVYAVEMKKDRVREIISNRARFGVANLDVIEGEAPGCLRGAGLPAPDSVFIGGGGTGVGGILGYVGARVKKGGRVVVNSVTLETTSKAFDFFRRKGWEKEAVMVSLARTKELNGLNLLSSNNPVFIITGRRPAG